MGKALISLKFQAVRRLRMTKPSAAPTAAHPGPEAAHGWRLAGLGFVFLWFFIGGIAHFAITEAEMRVVPPYIPWPRAAVLGSGVFELLGALGLMWRPTRRAAGWGLFALTIAVTPVHFYMLERPDLFNVPYWALLARLPVQLALLWLIVWSTAPRRGPTENGRGGVV
jgi:uncharacterized membrane protein